MSQILLKKTQAAYTLIEILVVSTILLLITGGGIAAFANFNQKQQVLSGAKELQSYLRMAQSLSRAGERPNGCNKLLGYRVVTSDVSDLKQVELQASCEGTTVITNNFTLPEGVTLDSDLDLTFLVLKGGVKGISSELQIEVTNNDNYSYQFMVAPSGEISGGEFTE